MCVILICKFFSVSFVHPLAPNSGDALCIGYTTDCLQ